MVSLAASSALQLMTVSEESGNGLYAPVSTFTASLAPALIFNVLSPTRASGRVEDTTRTVTPAFTVPAPYAICTGMDAVVPGAASLVAETCKLPERDRFAVICLDDELPPGIAVYCFSSSYTPDGAWVSAVRSTVLGVRARLDINSGGRERGRRHIAAYHRDLESDHCGIDDLGLIRSLLAIHSGKR